VVPPAARGERRQRESRVHVRLSRRAAARSSAGHSDGGGRVACAGLPVWVELGAERVR
jgi:hypothetical protein